MKQKDSYFNADWDQEGGWIPGNYRVVKYGDGSYSVESTGLVNVCALIERGEEAEKTAHLLSAAKDMLQVLEWLLSEYDFEDEYPMLILDAINKARGKDEDVPIKGD